MGRRYPNRDVHAAAVRSPRLVVLGRRRAGWAPIRAVIRRLLKSQRDWRHRGASPVPEPLRPCQRRSASAMKNSTPSRWPRRRFIDFSATLSCKLWLKSWKSIRSSVPGSCTVAPRICNDGSASRRTAKLGRAIFRRARRAAEAVESEHSGDAAIIGSSSVLAFFAWASVGDNLPPTKARWAWQTFIDTFTPRSPSPSSMIARRRSSSSYYT
jgi:hypothetical protein